MWYSDSRYPWIDIDLTSIERACVGSMSNRCRSEGVLYVGYAQFWQMHGTFQCLFFLKFRQMWKNRKKNNKIQLRTVYKSKCRVRRQIWKSVLKPHCPGSVIYSYRCSILASEWRRSICNVLSDWSWPPAGDATRPWKHAIRFSEYHPRGDWMISVK